MSLNMDLVGVAAEPLQFAYDWRDCVQYALGVGAKTDTELEFLFEKHGPKVLPTFAVVPSLPCLVRVCQQLGCDRKNILHGEQTVIQHAPLAPAGELTTTSMVTGIYDKGKGALVVVKATTRDQSGVHVFDNIFSVFIRGAGGFGGDRGAKSAVPSPPNRAPDIEVCEATSPEQAALYRLSGDLNPLHICPEHARGAGFNTPILHGLCTYGYAGRAVLGQLCAGEPERFRSLSGRFSGIVYPGDSLTTQLWRVDPERYIVQVCNQDGSVVLSNGLADVAASADAAR